LADPDDDQIDADRDSPQPLSADCLVCRSGHQDYCYTGDFCECGIEADPARLMREMVLKNQVLLGTVNAGAVSTALRVRSPARSRCHRRARRGINPIE
jgi:hypothetical protein